MSELLGLLKSAGQVRLEGGIDTPGTPPRWSIGVVTSSPLTARKTFSLFKSLLNLKATVLTVSDKRFGSRRTYLVKAPLPKPPLPDRLHGVLSFSLLGSESASFPESPSGVNTSLAMHSKRSGSGMVFLRLKKRTCCRHSFLRGIFLGSGSLSTPGRDHHLELRFSSETTANEIIDLLRLEGIKASSFTRKGEHVVYIKETSDILRLLGLVGAHTAVLKYEDALIVRGIREEINRMVNCETANVSKAVEAGLRQAALIKSLVEKYGLDALPVPLREIAISRMEHPEMSLRELGQGITPPLTKSGVNHRLKRIERIALDLGLGPCGQMPGSFDEINEINLDQVKDDA
ncbi:MAG TPA: DNA-binding protein WhiA [Clostridia bacterium]|nr:DNA-binding protein WhiA [Clostridia bacterium]